MTYQSVRSDFPTGSDDFTACLGGGPPDPETRNGAPVAAGNAVQEKPVQPQSDPYSNSDAAFNLDDFTALLGPADDVHVSLDSIHDVPRWVVWKFVTDRKTGKPRKVPFRPDNGRAASSTDPTTWGTYDEAVKRCAVINGDGVGIVLGTYDGLTIGGKDLDSCLDPDTGEIEEWATEALNRFASYAEISPSGKGIKILFLYRAEDAATVTDKARKAFSRGGHCEMALDLRDRYYAVTGKRVDSCPADLRPVPLDVLRWFVETAGPTFKAAGEGSRKVDRSDVAYGIACAVKRDGGNFEEFERRLQADLIIAEWAQDPRQVDRAWKRAPAPPWETNGDEFEDLDGDGDAPGVDAPKTFPLTEDGVALAFVEARKNRLRYCHTSAAWYKWTGSRWRRDETRQAFNWAREVCRIAGKGNAEGKALSKAATARAVETFAQTDPALAVTSDHWDRDRWLLGTPGGTVDLRSGELRAADPADAITKLAAVAPDAAMGCPLWLQFLHDATAGDAGLIRFLQQWCGYTLTGDTREHALLFIYGPGGNGKSVFLNTVTKILGDYVRTAGMDVFTVSKNDRHTQELARLRGARLVCASETEEGKPWAEVRIKQLTGGDVITARHMRQDDFEFQPEFKLIVVGNHKPILRNVDQAARRRFNVVPFQHRPPNPDRDLETKLRAEFPGILAWMIEGCRDWHTEGLVRPDVVTNATEDYFSAQDVFGQWLEDCCEVGPGFVALSGDLFLNYQHYAQGRGEGVYQKGRSFSEALQARGFTPIRDTMGIRGRGFTGLRLRSRDDLDEDRP